VAGNHDLAALLDVCQTISERAGQSMKLGPASRLLDIGLAHLTLARAALYASILRRGASAGEHMKEAIEYLRRAGTQDLLSQALPTRALFHAATGEFGGAREDLDEAFEIAERGPMRLHLADIHLHRARLFGLLAGRPPAYPWTSPRADLDAAKKLVDECGYGRRREELADAEEACERIHGGAG
jgi:hypothetical protein